MDPRDDVSSWFFEGLKKTGILIPVGATEDTKLFAICKEHIFLIYFPFILSLLNYEILYRKYSLPHICTQCLPTKPCSKINYLLNPLLNL